MPDGACAASSPCSEGSDAWLIEGVLFLLDRLTMRASRRVEYLADRASARAGSTAAAVGLLNRRLVADSALTTLQREVNDAARSGARTGSRAGDRANGLWERLTAHMESIPEREHERPRRAGALRGHNIDETHPPARLRRDCLLVGAPRPVTVAGRAGAPRPATVTGDEDRARGVAAEPTEARREVARRILRDGVTG
ncbi:hypothetical protein [Streptomyces sp. NPDC007905]|uniref:hypothetical protein n=1 Tax=Streptomyces sp. NPDC007905 TaxID=3364788 RepID=UPI0036EC7D6A